MEKITTLQFYFPLAHQHGTHHGCEEKNARYLEWNHKLRKQYAPQIFYQPHLCIRLCGRIHRDFAAAQGRHQGGLRQQGRRPIRDDAVSASLQKAETQGNSLGGSPPTRDFLDLRDFDTATLRHMLDVASNFKKGGTSSRPLAGKTGTTDDYKDNWFVGFTPDIVVAVWVGYDDPRSLGQGETGGLNAAPIFREVIAAALAGSPAVPFRAPPGVALVRIQTDRGETILEAFRPGTENSATNNHWFYTELRGRVNFTDWIASPLLRKPSGNHHNGNLRLGFDTSLAPGAAGRADYDKFVSWIVNSAPE